MLLEYKKPRIRDIPYRIDPSGCWFSPNKPGPKGYLQLHLGGKLVLIHRQFYELAKGPVPAGLVIDHLCRNKACCNPDHLEAVTQKENTMRGPGPAARYAKRTHCPKCGLELSSNNLRPKEIGRRRCLNCDRKRVRESNRRWRANQQMKFGLV